MQVESMKDMLLEMPSSETALLRFQAALLIELLDEIRGLRMDLANESDPDAEPDTFQTLNGPSKDQNTLRYGVKGEYGE